MEDEGKHGETEESAAAEQDVMTTILPQVIEQEIENVRTFALDNNLPKTTEKVDSILQRIRAADETDGPVGAPLLQDAVDALGEVAGIHRFMHEEMTHRAVLDIREIALREAARLDGTTERAERARLRAEIRKEALDRVRERAQKKGNN